MTCCSFFLSPSHVHNRIYGYVLFVVMLAVEDMLVDMPICELLFFLFLFFIYIVSQKLKLFRHFVETQHTFSMRLGRTQRVWDYIGGNSLNVMWLGKYASLK